jgi:hypothetical protein
MSRERRQKGLSIKIVHKEQPNSYIFSLIAEESLTKWNSFLA